MLVLYFVFVVLVCGASAAPSREKRFDVYDPDFPFSMAYGYARPFGAFSGASAYAGPGAFAGSAFNPFFPFRMPVYVPMPMPIAPTDYSSFNTWYKGDNVCVEKKVINDDAELSEWMNAGLSGDFNYNQETCRGNSDTYVCINRIQTNEGSKREVTKYKCCHGFVRSFDGRSGCVEETDDDGSSQVTKPVVSSVRLSDQFKYSVLKGGSKSKSGVESVPAQ